MKLRLQQHIEQLLQNYTSTKSNFNWQTISGGSINETYKVSTTTHTFFVKLNSATIFKNGFKEEVLGLQFLEKNNALVPEIIFEGNFENDIFLVLEWVENGEKTANFWRNFAEQLTNLHQQTNTKFGLDHSNSIGELFQKNNYCETFSDFFIENRLNPQVKLAFETNKLQQKHLKQFEELYAEIPAIFPVEKPSAVHGDLWSGNFICSNNEKAVLIDPAVYYGHREMDIAMSQLFGWFSTEFYHNYQEILPLAPCFNLRNNFYNLYPLLVHLNLFGKSYLGNIENIITKF
ncbi:Fructosamine-3-kinase [Lutibacter agarilyticus]|uniref:Fructosamine-3-kinase n=1 Tax=Lutibacter agarilyticus TaxID=1109740 RepID=A0A238W336_9FLAO|nr:fructosamine kinase family protein [Lutibacter agarilyticus]SNR40754.1 Fructosamine-3-kinase [Lutibacter agarilyticus]